MTRDEAVIAMVDSNLHRERILPSERAYAYKMKMEARKRQGARTDLTSTPLVSKLRTDEAVGSETGESREQIRRYVRLTYLIKEILDLVDDGRIAFRPAVELSYLTVEQQKDLFYTIESEDATPSLAQAIEMKKKSQKGALAFGNRNEHPQQYIRVAPQQELLYKNSFNMLSWCDRIYKRDKENGELYSEENDYFGMPILAYKRGYTLLRISAAPSSMGEYVGDTPVKIRKVLSMVEEWDNDVVVIGVRHIPVLEEYRKTIEEAFPDRLLFVVTGGNTSFAKRRALRKTLKESENGILLCTQQSLPSSVNFEYVNKIVIPELYYNNSRMSQFYMRFIRYTSTEWKDIYFVTYAGSIESNLMQMVMAKEKLNLFMKGQDADIEEIYDKFGVDYNLLSLLMRREADSKGKLRIRWGE